MAILGYLILCAIIGVLGRHRAMGFFGFFILAALLTPLIALFILWGSAPRRSVAR